MRTVSTSDFFYRLRGCAILSVAYAHSFSLSDVVLRQVASLIGIIGVPLFLIASGYYFKEQPLKEFLRSKLINIIIPWFIWGSVAYFISNVADRETIHFWKHVSYLIGYGTWLYYVPIYLIITFIFNFINSRPYLILFLLISFFSCTLTFSSLHNIEIITPYQNPLNWVGFFALGVLLKEKSFEKWSKNSIGVILIVGILFILLGYLTIFFGLKVCYWNPLCFIFELLGFILVSNLCIRLNDGRFLSTLGKYSYLIYFLHMQFGVFTANLLLSFAELPEILLFFIKPLLVIMITAVYVKLIILTVNLGGVQKFSRYLGIPIK